MNKNTIESLKNYITEEIEQRGIKDNQIAIDFTDLYEEFEEIRVAAEQLGYIAEEGNNGEGFGVHWLYKDFFLDLLEKEESERGKYYDR